MGLLKSAYHAEDLIGALRSVGVEAGDVLFSHLALPNLGLISGCLTTESAYDAIFNCIKQVIGESGTLIIPTYTYSFTRGEVYDPDQTESRLGGFTEYFRRQEGVLRSRDPIFSVAAYGARASEFIDNLPRSSFGKDSVYHRLLQANARLVNFGLTIKYLTFMHFIEAEADVPYRFFKPFRGSIISAGQKEDIEWESYVRILNENTVLNLDQFYELARESGGLSIAPVGRGELQAMTSRDVEAIARRMLETDPWSLANGPAFEITDAMKV